MNNVDAMEPEEMQTTEQLLPLVYAELRRLAAHKMASENPGQTLQPTALVHEAWLKLGGEQNRQWRNRNHFFAAAAEAMRRILTDNARRKLRVRHGGGQQRVDLEDATNLTQLIVCISKRRFMNESENYECKKISLSDDYPEHRGGSLCCLRPSPP